jgi:hypothetical protein
LNLLLSRYQPLKLPDDYYIEFVVEPISATEIA